jgi:hypothetical protein
MGPDSFLISQTYKIISVFIVLIKFTLHATWDKWLNDSNVLGNEFQCDLKLEVQ